ncbi:MAG: ATP-dependent sacrificial sulfur transferase LarE [Opitutales bacterium]|nr:ATP-dependent sacrificial sulfur transferase LarE [Opitutales bacterium]
MNLKTDENLRAFVRKRGRAAVALSGGVDSSALIAFCAAELGGENCLAITAAPPYAVPKEISEAEKLCEKLGVRLIKIPIEKIPDEIKFNPPERCYLCKRAIFSKIISEAKGRGFSSVFDGTNADDLSDYRPGMKALKELGVESPFLACGLGKAQIREIARCLMLDSADSPASACLLTRLEHGAEIKIETLKKIAALEEILREKYSRQVRARVIGENVFIECPAENFSKVVSGAAEISEAAKALGFRRCALDLSGYKQGSMNAKK